MNSTSLPARRIQRLLNVVTSTRVLVVGDVMLDQYLYGRVGRISPEAPVPVVEFERETFMPGGAANVARNLRALGGNAELIGVTGNDGAGRNLRRLLEDQGIPGGGLLARSARHTSLKTRIVAHQQQIVRVDRESRAELDPRLTRDLLAMIEEKIAGADAVIVGDYGKGVVSQVVLDRITALARPRGLWVSLDPKPIHAVNLRGLSLITPNRKEAFELARRHDGSRPPDPLRDAELLGVADKLLRELQPALLLITLGDQGMLLCRRGQKPCHFPTVAQEVFDVSGAGDTVIASFTLAIAAGASPEEAAVFSNHAAGVVVGKTGTATVTSEELLVSFQRER